MLGPHSLNTLPGKTTKTPEAIYPIYVQHVEGFHLDFCQTLGSSLVIIEMMAGKNYLQYCGTHEKKILLNMNSEFKGQ